MLPKAFLVEDLGLQLVRTMADLQELRRRTEETAHVVELHRKRIDALRKRVERSAARQQKRRQEQG